MSADNNTLNPGPKFIAPVNASSAPVLVDDAKAYARMLGMLRDVRAEVQNLQSGLKQILLKEAMVDAVTRTREIFAVVRQNSEIYEYNGVQINRRLQELRALMGTDSLLYDRYGDELTHIENRWERAVKSWPMLPDSAAQGNDAVNDSDHALAEEIVAEARQVSAHLDDLIYHVGILTIPDRLVQHLEQIRIGQALDFHQTFRDEIPNDTHRQKIMQYLASRPQALPNGVINSERGLVLHASADISRRRRSFFYILLTSLVGAVIVWLAANLGTWFELPDWPIHEGQATNLLVGYAFVLLGSFLHLGVDGIKQARAAEPGSALAIEDWLTWIHTHEVDVMTGVVSVWIGFFGVVMMSGTIDWQTAFLVGYSVDSFVDMFLQRFTTTVSTRTAQITL